jgi:hypothetical protein
LQLRPPELAIDPSDPFATDRLNRREFGLALLELVKSTSDSFVLSLDAPWGQGKTTFLKMWRAELSKRQLGSLYFNAWESDFCDDPLVALLGELELGMAVLDPSRATASGKNFARAKKIGLKLAKRAGPAAVRLATMGILNLDDLSEEAIAQVGEKLAEDQLKQYEESKKSMAAFRDALQALAEQLGKSRGDAIPLIFVVDELDRCRPSYAIRLLETIKHLFTVPGVVFVVATDVRQLSTSVQHTYGAGIDADGYLRRFFDVTLSLPRLKGTSFIEAQFQRFGFETFFSERKHAELRHDKNNVLEVFSHLFRATECSLRDQERCFTLLGLAIRTTPENKYLHPILLAVLIVLRIKNQPMYDAFGDGRVEPSAVVNYFSASPVGRHFFDSDRGYGQSAEAYLHVCRQDSFRGSTAAERFRASADDQTLTERERERAMCMSELISHHSFRNAHGCLKHMLEKIELVARSPDEFNE